MLWRHRSFIRISTLIAMAIALAAAPGEAQRRGRGGAGEVEPLHGQLKELTPRPGVTQSFILVRPKGAPVASVILFTGGTGRLALSPSGIGSGKTNFVVRNREGFAEHGLLVAVVDTPSDHSADLGAFRASEEHAQDVKAVIAFLRQTASVPVWLIGTSRGTVSAGNAAARLTDGGPDGLVLTSSLVGGHAESMRDVALDAIRVPTLVVHHKNDQCPASPYAGAQAMLTRLRNVPKHEFLAFDGGDTPRSEPCEALSYHGYLGLDAEVVKAIADWIKSAGKP